jgi:catechol 2,3-dioxygenase-like lactoylglutathione lyase family enzyme
MEINGVAHTFITAGDFAAARAFYGQLLPFLGLAVVADSVNTFFRKASRTTSRGRRPSMMGRRRFCPTAARRFSRGMISGQAATSYRW